MFKNNLLCRAVAALLIFSMCNAQATDFSTTGVIDGSQTANLITAPSLSNGIVFGTGFNTTTYQNFYTQSNLTQYYAPGGGNPTTILAPTGFLDASSELGGLNNRAYNVYDLRVKGAGVYVFQVTDPLKSVNWTSTTAKDLMAALYVKQGSGTAFNSANTTQNLVMLNDDIANSGSANPYPMFYQNDNATDCITLSLVYFPWGGGISLPADVTITASGPGRIATSCSSLGPSQSATQTSVILSASALQGAMTLQNTVLINGFTYDCSVFDKNGVCISTGGRNTTVSAGMINNTSALLIGSYRLDKNNSRIGISLDQNLSTSNPGGAIKQSNDTPMVGVFAVWQENLNEAGWQVKVSAGMGQKNTTVQRTVVSDSEPGVGSAKMITQGAQVLFKYGLNFKSQAMLLPYAGIRYTRNNMGGYTEQSSATVTAPLTYNPVNTNSSTALVGLEARYKVLPKFTTFASGGVERNVSTNYDQYVATNSSIGYIAPVSMNPDMVRTRPTATVGGYYDIEKNQRVGITGIYRQEIYQAVGTYSVMATYTIGL